MRSITLYLSATLLTSAIAGCTGENLTIEQEELNGHASVTSSTSFISSSASQELAQLPDNIKNSAWKLASFGYEMSGHTPAYIGAKETLEFRSEGGYFIESVEEVTRFQRHDGCNSHSGHYILNNDSLTFNFNGLSTIVFCDFFNDSNYQLQDQTVGRILRSNLRFEVNDGELILTAVGGEQLIYTLD